MNYTTYIIYSQKLDKYYVGHTENLELRLEQHNTGISTFTSKANDWVIKYNETFNSREAARLREAEIKKKKSRKYIEWLISSAG
jgi:putative endonuclease